MLLILKVNYPLNSVPASCILMKLTDLPLKAAGTLPPVQTEAELKIFSQESVKLLEIKTSIFKKCVFGRIIHLS